MRTIVFRLGTRSRSDLRDFLHSRLNFEFTDITWLDAGLERSDRVPVRFFNDLLALRALLLWDLFRWRSRAIPPRPLPPPPHPTPLATQPAPRQLIKLRRSPAPHHNADASNPENDTV